MNFLNSNSVNDTENLADLVRRGGVYHNVSGSYPVEILSNIINNLHNNTPDKTQNTALHPMPDFNPQKAEALLQAVIERETIISTGIGKGIALPHPRTPLLEENEKPFVAIAFPAQPLDWNTPDGSKVHTIFLIISKSANQQLGILSKINFLCQQDKFYDLISSGAQKEGIIAAIEEAERAWGKY